MNAPEPEATTPEITTEPQKDDRYECRACGYVYEPDKGDNTNEIPAGTPFRELPPNWRCPVCGVPRNQFANIGPRGQASGFKENYQYGFGVNTLTSTQKTLLIFGGLLVAFAIMMSFYGLS